MSKAKVHSDGKENMCLPTGAADIDPVLAVYVLDRNGGKRRNQSVPDMPRIPCDLQNPQIIIITAFELIIGYNFSQSIR